MSQPRPGKHSSRGRAAKSSGHHAARVAGGLVLAAGIAVAAILLRGGAERRGAGSPPAPPASHQARAPTVTAAAGSDFQALTGRWLRPDGGYILEIRDVDAQGAVAATYLSIEGVSLVSNYRTQFNKIVQTTSYVELLQRMKTKQDETTSSDGAPREPVAPAPSK